MKKNDDLMLNTRLKEHFFRKVFINRCKKIINHLFLYADLCLF